MKKEDLMEGYDVENIYKKLRILGNRNSIEFGNLEKKYNSHHALLLAEYAQENNKITDFSKEIFQQYYSEDKDISSTYFLKDVCYRVDLDYDMAIYKINNGMLDFKLNENHILKDELNIDLFPTYIINGEDKLSGILTKRSFLKAFESLNK